MKLALAVLVLGGCTWAFMETVPKNYRPSDGEPRCTASKGWAAFDASEMAGYFVAAAVIGSIPDFDGKAATEFGLVGLGVLHMASALTGLREADRCEDARRARDAYRPAAP